MSLEGATTEEGKLQKVLCQIDVAPNVESITRLGRDGGGGTKRPMLVKLSRAVRDKVMSKTGKLKDAGELYSRSYVKKDVHPRISKELREIESG